MAPRRPVSGSIKSKPSSSTSTPSATTTKPPASSRQDGPVRSARSSEKRGHGQSKVMKRAQRHDALMSRIAKRATPLKSAQRRRRRPSSSALSAQNLTTTLSGLADALPDPSSVPSKNQAKRSDAIDLAGPGPVRIRNASLRSRAGAQKKRATLESHERDWFSRNLASMSNMSAERTERTEAVPTQTGTAPSAQSPWEALKSHVAGNLQKARQSDQ